MELVCQTTFDSFYHAKKNNLVLTNVDSVTKENSTVKVQNAVYLISNISYILHRIPFHNFKRVIT